MAGISGGTDVWCLKVANDVITGDWAGFFGGRFRRRKLICVWGKKSAAEKSMVSKKREARERKFALGVRFLIEEGQER